MGRTDCSLRGGRPLRRGKRRGGTAPGRLPGMPAFCLGTQGKPGSSPGGGPGADIAGAFRGSAGTGDVATGDGAPALVAQGLGVRAGRRGDGGAVSDAGAASTGEGSPAAGGGPGTAASGRVGATARARSGGGKGAPCAAP